MSTAPLAGPAAAAAVATAAEIVAACGRASRASWPGGGGAVAQADTLRERATELADADVDAYRAASAALRERSGSGDAALGVALARAAEVPLAIVRTGADVAMLAAEVAERGDPGVRADAAAACALAAGAAQAAAHLVAVNLAVTPDDPWLAEADALVRDAASAHARLA
ncbi:MAG TPA: cyclodeaminase/cyclohydrolase family protein [Thermoleophilaceae bacterium]